MAITSETDLLTVTEAAKRLKVSTITLHRWIKQGIIPSYRVGPRALRIRAEDLESVVRPARGTEEPPVNRWMASDVTDLAHALRPMNEEEKQRVRDVLERARVRGEEILARRGGVLLDESWPIIREARDDPSRWY